VNSTIVRNPKYVRQCNLEEVKEISINTGLLSCTIKTLTCTRRHDVAGMEGRTLEQFLGHMSKKFISVVREPQFLSSKL
jgi:hypothetical protein